MRYSIIAKLRGPLAEAVAVEWTDLDAPRGSAAGWEPCLRLRSGEWRLYSYGAAEGRARHWLEPGQMVGNLGLRYRLTAAGPWSEISESRKALTIVADPGEIPAALGAGDWAQVEETGATGAFVLLGTAAAAVAVEWSLAAGQEQTWQPALSLGGGIWRPAVAGAADLPEGLEGEPIAIRYRLAVEGPWSPASLDSKAVVPAVDETPPVPVLPLLVLAPVLAGTGKIGAELTVTPGLWSGDPAFALHWCRDGEEIAGATAGVYVPGPADDQRNLTCVVAATNAAGSTVATTAAVRVTYPAPSAKGELFEEIFDEDTGPQEVAAAGDFVGENLSFSVDGAAATIDVQTGVVTIPTDTPISGEMVTVTASNSGGEATSSFMVTVEAAESGEEDAVFALEAADIEIVRTEWRPATQTNWFTPVVRFPGLAGGTVDAIEWTTGVDPVPEHHFEVVQQTGTAGEFALYMRDPAKNAPEASPRVDFSVWSSGEARTEMLRFRWRRSADGPWSPLSVAQSVVAPELPEIPTPPVSSEEPPWRSLFRRAAHHLREEPNLPEHYPGGRYGGEGYQHLQTGAWSGDGSAYYAGQDMGLVRKSVSVEGRRAGEVWFSPPNVGLRGLGCMTVAVDPADPDVALALTSVNYADLNGASSLVQEGLYRTADGGITWDKVVSPHALVQHSRYFYFTLSPHPATGGSASSRRWLFVQLNRVTGGQGSVWRSTNGGVNWTEVAKLTQSTYGRINGIHRAPNDYQSVYMCSQQGIFYSSNEGVTWGRPGWHSRFSADCRSMWIDPENYRHMIVSVAGGDSSNYGVWETTDNGASWTRIFSTYATGCIAVGAKNPDARRLIVVMPASGESLPRIRRFDGSWVTATHDKYDPDSWQHQGMTGASTELMHVVANPIDPEMFVLHGRHGPYYPKAGTEATHWVACDGYFSSEYHSLGVNRGNHLQMAFGALDQLCVGSLDGWSTAYQWTLSQAQKDSISTSSKRGRGICWLPDPWPAGADAPASSSVVGRIILAAGASGGGGTSRIFYQNKSARSAESSANAWYEFTGSDASGGGLVYGRNFVDYDPDQPNNVYCGPNRSTNGGTSWMATGENIPIVAMSKVNGQTVWGQADSHRILYRSTNRGANWTLIRNWGFTNRDSNDTGLVYTFGGTDNCLLVAGGDRFNMSWPQPRIYNVSENAFYTINCAPFFNDEPWRGFRSAAVCRYAPRWAMLNFECSGGPQTFLVRFSADYKTQESITDVTYNLPRVQGALKIHNHDGTGDWIFSGGNGTFVYPAPDDWRHSDPAKQTNHRALFRNAARSIDNGWRELL